MSNGISDHLTWATNDLIAFSGNNGGTERIVGSVFKDDGLTRWRYSGYDGATNGRWYASRDEAKERCFHAAVTGFMGQAWA